MFTLLSNNTCIKFNTYNTHNEGRIRLFKFTNTVISLQKITRNSFSDKLILVYTTEQEIETLSTNTKNYQQ